MILKDDNEGLQTVDINYQFKRKHINVLEFSTSMKKK